MIWKNFLDNLPGQDFCTMTGRVTKVSSLVIESSGPPAFVGELCRIIGHNGQSDTHMAEVVGLRDKTILLMPFGETRGISIDAEVQRTESSVSICVGPELLGQVIDPFGKTLKSSLQKTPHEKVALRGVPRNPLSRKKINEVFHTGQRAIDAFLPIGKGQRIGIFSGSGVGKSTLLGMISRESSCDINVIALIGERGREVGEFLSNSLGQSGLSKSIVVVATSDQPALVRELAAHTATAIAEYFCGQGKDVLLIMDSVTRFAMAHREIGLSIGEPATARGYTPSAFAALPKLLERAGTFEGSGSITAIYTVLVEGDDLHEPVSDHMRAILDGHIVLSRDLANHGHYPAIDLLKSISRVATDLWSKQEKDVVKKALKLLSIRDRYQDMIEIGVYRPGSNANVDDAIAVYPELEKFLMQDPEEHTSRVESFARLHKIVEHKGA